ncbi:nucleotidyltransferase domain-containing protein [Caldalkalibacillus mannanilyticus]|uniref:nucleotidyltransferase domain-containing protein n=1 Tax=Caldalkalibacillus mannanilyticus TaxID=1418 RepID=UPI0004681B14|nr:nucleotidyltransferase domain-containing protein [Caldalkalibacillus mannanilyticus]
MNEKIIEEIKNIELTKDVTILFACESGSRAWGFPSKDSDYDVRFIYIHPPEWYLSIDEKRDVIELPINDLLDINGWDIRKALKLFRKSNPPLQEWLSSEIVYYRSFSFVDKLRKMSSEVFSPISCMYHYLSMARGNYREFLQGERVKIKKYFYVLRPVLACKWIEKYNTMPPILFQDLVNDIVPSGILNEEISKLLERKINGDELDFEPRINVINEFIENEIDHIDAFIKTIKHSSENPTEKLDRLFRDTLKEVYSSS